MRENVLVSVEFQTGLAPLLALGQRTPLEFLTEGLDTSIHSEGEVVLRTDDAARRCYCFRAEISKRVLLHLLDRRRERRTRFQPFDGVKLSLPELGDPPPEATLHDVSAMGLSILLDPALEPALVGRAQLRLSVRFPGEEAAIEVLAAIRHRRFVGAELLYGLEMEGQIPEFMRAKERFLLHVASLGGARAK